MSQQHTFEGSLHWSGGSREDDHGKLKLARSFVVRFKDKHAIEGSSPVVFSGDDTRHNPETLMVASLMACHHLTYLAVCERANIRVLEYSDSATGTLHRFAHGVGVENYYVVFIFERDAVGDADVVGSSGCGFVRSGDLVCRHVGESPTRRAALEPGAARSGDGNRIHGRGASGSRKRSCGCFDDEGY